MDYITVKEAAEKWGIAGRAITYHIAGGRIHGTIKKGNLWLIPASASKPEDLRKNGCRHSVKDGGE
ncbi:MAG: helix-turn-helix domain-containing protein [Oscillospiraceae bacterium]|jgi:hypothetical protein|nr:helix-turn-helix domain-containing protein [Oscillospiraceae bacterium]